LGPIADAVALDLDVLIGGSVHLPEVTTTEQRLWLEETRGLDLCF
jgi:hypothetical protein